MRTDSLGGAASIRTSAMRQARIEGGVDRGVGRLGPSWSTTRCEHRLCAGRSVRGFPEAPSDSVGCCRDEPDLHPRKLGWDGDGRPGSRFRTWLLDEQHHGGRPRRPERAERQPDVHPRRQCHRPRGRRRLSFGAAAGAPARRPSGLVKPRDRTRSKDQMPVIPNARRKRVWPGLGVVAVAAVLAAGALGASNDSAALGQARVRTVTDMPDDVSGPQVHFLYVVPADGPDGQLDTNGGMEQSIARIERWVVTHADNQGLRVDTHAGVPDITFVRLRHTDAQATASNPWPLWVIGEDLVAAGF